MNNVQTIALSKAVTAKAVKIAREGLEVGNHIVDVSVRVTGSITVGDDYEQEIVAKAKPWDLLALALSKLNGVTVESLVREAAEGTVDTSAVKAQADTALGAIKGTTATLSKGKVTTKLAIKYAE